MSSKKLDKIFENSNHGNPGNNQDKSKDQKTQGNVRSIVKHKKPDHLDVIPERPSQKQGPERRLSLKSMTSIKQTKDMFKRYTRHNTNANVDNGI